MTPIQSLFKAFALSSLVERAKVLAKLKRWAKPVTPEMTAWAISIRDNPTTYPMGATETKVFPPGTALARVEQHTWTFRDGKPCQCFVRSTRDEALKAVGLAE